MPLDIMQSLESMPIPALIAVAVLFFIFVFYAVFKNREVGTFRKKYLSFASRDLFIEDLINSLSRRTMHSFLLFISLISAVLTAGMILGNQKSYISGPGGKEDLESKLSALQSDYDAVKAEKELLNERLSSLTRTGDAGEKEKQLSDNYKAAMVNYFYLLKCGSANFYEGLAMTSMLSLELAKIGSPSTIIWATVDDARNLYNREYSKNTCDKAAVTQVAASQKQFVESANKNLQAALSFTPPSLTEATAPETTLSNEITQPKVEQQALPETTQQQEAPATPEQPTAPQPTNP